MAPKKSKRFVKGAPRMVNTLQGLAERLQVNIDRATNWGLADVSDSVQKAGEHVLEAIEALNKLIADGWTPPRKNGVREEVEEGATVSITQADRETYCELYGVDDDDLESLKVVAVRDSKRDAIIVKTKGGQQFPIPRRHVGSVAQA